MSWKDKLKKGANMFLFTGDKPKTVMSKLSAYPTPQDLNENQIPDMLEQQKPEPRNKFLDAIKAKEIPKTDKYGCYVSTITYPLPPVSWEKKQFDLNRRRRNGKNKYL
jgi:hypothetical protein